MWRRRNLAPQEGKGHLGASFYVLGSRKSEAPVQSATVRIGPLASVRASMARSGNQRKRLFLPPSALQLRSFSFSGASRESCG